jgi:hypothetical protein
MKSIADQPKSVSRAHLRRRVLIFWKVDSMNRRGSHRLWLQLSLAMVLCAVAMAAAHGPDSKPLRLTSKHHWYGRGVKVSVKRTDVTSRRLRTMARALQDQTKAMSVHVFLERRAAEAFRFSEFEPHAGDYEAARHYVAGYSRLGHEAFVITPFGFSGPENEVTVDEGATDRMSCQYELDGRCLLGLKPMDVDLTDLAGTVTLTATLTPAGVLSGAQVVEVNAQDEAQRARLTEVVQRNLPSWWLDPGERPIAVRITYAVGPSAIAPTGAELDLEYPRRLTHADLDRITPASKRDLMWTQHRQMYFRVTATVVPR